MMRWIFAIFPIALVLASPAHADFRAGLDAFKRGDYAVAKTEFHALAETGMSAAQTNLGLMYSKGYGVAPDAAEAVRWYRLAAEQGQPVAQNNLGFMYINGQGGPKDRVLGLMWLTLSLEHGYEKAGKAVLVLKQTMTKPEFELAKQFAVLWKAKFGLNKNRISALR